MLRNYIKIAWRNILKRKMSSVISIVSLASGLAVCFIIGLFVLHELSYDRFIPDSERIVRVVTGHDGSYIAETFPGLAHTLETKLPGVETVTEILGGGEYLITHNNAAIEIKNVYWIDSNFTEIFPVNTLKGNAEKALTSPHKAVITRSMAQKLFGDKQAIGQILGVEIFTGYTHDYEVSAVIKDPPANLHFDYNAILSLSIPSRIQERYNGNIKWGFYHSYVYAKLDKNISIEAFKEGLAHLEKQIKPAEWGDEPMLYIQPLAKIHLGPNMGNAIAPQGDRKLLYIFSTIALLILGIACFNYMSLSTARTISRTSEIGVRKAAGATQGNLFFQFMTEAVLISLLAFPVALLFTEIALPFVYGFVGEHFAYSLFDHPVLMISALGIVLISGIISGIYPAVTISSFNPAKVFNKAATTDSHRSLLQKGLVVIQFGVVVLFLIVTGIIFHQMKFVQNKELGFNKEQVVYFGVGSLQGKFDAFKEQLLNYPMIANVSSGPPLGLGRKNMAVTAADSSNKKGYLNILRVGYDYIETMGLELKKGRIFSKKYAAKEESSVILNELAAAWFGLQKDVTGKTIEINDEPKNVIGLVADFHNESLKEKKQPVALLLNPRTKWTGLVRLSSSNIHPGISAIKDVWDSFLPGRPLDFSFLDESIEAQYRQEQKQAMLMTVFTVIAILVACFGLFGLAAILTTNRTKEIGIRKVMGATVSNIVSLLSKDFVKLVLVGFVIAVPIAWYFMQQWLQNFAYRIDIDVGIFLLAGALALLIALATVSWQSIRAALANPVDSLRSE